MTATKTLTAADVTGRPKTRPAKLPDGTNTGMWVALHDSVCLLDSGEAMYVPRGTTISAAISGGFDGRLPAAPGANSTTCKIGTDGQFITYRNI